MLFLQLQGYLGYEEQEARGKRFVRIIAIAVLPYLGVCNFTRSRNEWGAFGGLGALPWLAEVCGGTGELFAMCGQKCLLRWGEKLLVARAGLITVRMFLLKLGS